MWQTYDIFLINKTSCSKHIYLIKNCSPKDVNSAAFNLIITKQNFKINFNALDFPYY